MNLIAAWQAAKAWLTAPLFPAKTATEEPPVDDTVQSGTATETTSPANVTVTAETVVIAAAAAPSVATTVEDKAKALFSHLVAEGHKAEDLFIDARAEIFALAAKLV